MSWTILINTQEGHNKFWSYNENGEVHWGRIGTAGQSGQYDMGTVMDRARAKLNSGYRVFGEGLDYYSPSGSQTRASPTPRPSQEEVLGLVVEERPHRTRRTRTPRERPQPISQSEDETVPEFNRNHIIPNVDSYKTDSKGYITYRSGYSRELYDKFSASLKEVLVSEMITTRNDNGVVSYSHKEDLYYKKAKEYFNRISSDYVYNKPATFDELRNPSRPTYIVLFFEKGKILEVYGIYGVNRATGICDFLSLKQVTPNRATILKRVIKNISNLVSTSTITFKIKNDALRQEIKNIADYNIHSTEANILKYNVLDIRTGIPNSSGKPARIIE